MKKWKKPMSIEMCRYYSTERKIIIALVREALAREAEIEGHCHQLKLWDRVVDRL